MFEIKKNFSNETSTDRQRGDMYYQRCSEMHYELLKLHLNVPGSIGYECLCNVLHIHSQQIPSLLSI